MFFCLLVVSAFEYQYFLYKFSSFSPLDYFFPTHPLISFLQTKATSDRVYGYDTGRLETNLSIQWRLQSPEGYDSLYIKRYGELINASYPRTPTRSDAVLPESMPINDSYAKRVLFNLLGVKYITYKDDLAPLAWSPQTWKFPSDRFNLIYQKSSWKVYENLNAIPRTSIFYNFVMENNSNKIIQTLFDKNFSYDQELILEETPSNFFPKKGLTFTPAKIINYQPNEIKIETDTKNDGLLFLADNYYPGWNAHVDGVPTKIYRADYTFRAIPVKAGNHLVYLNYMPKSFIYGALISAISLVIACLILTRRETKFKKV